MTGNLETGAKHQFVCLVRRRSMLYGSAQVAAGIGQLPEGGAGNHGADLRHGLDGAEVGPFAFGDGVQHQNPAALAFAALQRRQGPGLVDGFGIREDQQGGGFSQHGGLVGAEGRKGRAQVGAPAVDTGLAHKGAEGVHVLQPEGVRLHHGLGEEIGAGILRHLV